MALPPPKKKKRNEYYHSTHGSRCIAELFIVNGTGEMDACFVHAPPWLASLFLLWSLENRARVSSEHSQVWKLPQTKQKQPFKRKLFLTVLVFYVL